MVGFFVAHLEEQQSKMVALAGGLHRRLGAESVVLRLDDNLLQLIWEQVERRCVVPPVESLWPEGGMYTHPHSITDW